MACVHDALHSMRAGIVSVLCTVLFSVTAMVPPTQKLLFLLHERRVQKQWPVACFAQASCLTQGQQRYGRHRAEGLGRMQQRKCPLRCTTGAVQPKTHSRCGRTGEGQLLQCGWEGGGGRRLLGPRRHLSCSGSFPSPPEQSFAHYLKMPRSPARGPQTSPAFTRSAVGTLFCWRV